MDSPTLHRHPSLYFPDGDIVLCAAAKSGIYQAFRVDRVYLIRSSPVLRDMLSGSSPGAVTSSDVFDGVQMLRLNDDASELANLLELLYNTVTVSLQRLDPSNPLRAMGILRLATKYAMDPLRKIILHCIEADWPRTLGEWDQLQATVAHARELNGGAGGPFIDDCFPEPAAAIRFASEFGCPSILPAAFYQLAITDPAADWDEFRRGNDDDDAAAWEHRCALATGGRTARWELLDRANLMRFLRGRTALDAWLPDVEDCLTSYLGTAECVDHFHCERVRAECRRVFLLEGPGRARPFDPLHALRFLLDLVPQHQLCGACLRHIRGELLRVRQEIWDELPTMFGIPTPPS
ncbi:hypothetical protein PHLGIDRAFT_86570 [Phlebiopsis gigantea 11061_1 CR5-6]|uniref:BTB domain-containing protein n=1 Tax=Phlebiopsis gigantea (strain 11061_1 CR5-6) TaxID=745531 RepID=A0A0C3PQS2_PHLG1|nr:hypothetical protein PHLGIDRAFT_86570 [Phlebiopsis gigantea 11061_1 CR5-6]